jgi:hypothetical protein
VAAVKARSCDAERVVVSTAGNSALRGAGGRWPRQATVRSDVTATLTLVGHMPDIAMSAGSNKQATTCPTRELRQMRTSRQFSCGYHVLPVGGKTARGSHWRIVRPALVT